MSDGLLWSQPADAIRFDLLRDASLMESLAPEATMFAHARESEGLVLRGGAVSINGRTVLLVGPAGSGASAIAAAAVQAGAELVADGALVLDLQHDGVSVAPGSGPGQGSIALWPAAAELLGLDRLDPIFEGAAKLRWQVERCATVARRVDAIVGLTATAAPGGVATAAGAAATALLAQARALPKVAPQTSFGQVIFLSTTVPVGALQARGATPSVVAGHVEAWLQ